MNQFLFQVKLGTIGITWNQDGILKEIGWRDSSDGLEGTPVTRETPALVENLADRMMNYFNHGAPLGAVPWEWIDQSGWTDFQRSVYHAIAKIPHGETRTYGWVAGRVGRTTACRAVGQALRSNPLLILVPCHRVVAANSIGGFMGADDPNLPELRLKQTLISLEEEYCSPVFGFLKFPKEALA